MKSREKYWNSTGYARRIFRYSELSSCRAMALPHSDSCMHKRKWRRKQRGQIYLGTQVDSNLLKTWYFWKSKWIIILVWHIANYLYISICTRVFWFQNIDIVLRGTVAWETTGFCWHSIHNRDCMQVMHVLHQYMYEVHHQALHQASFFVEFLWSISHFSCSNIRLSIWIQS